MNWNNRVWKNTDANGNASYGVFETFYNDAGEICGATQEPSLPIGETTAELKNTLVRMLNCLSHPLLDGDGFVFAKYCEDSVEAVPEAGHEALGDIVIALNVEEAVSIPCYWPDNTNEEIPVVTKKSVKGKK